MDKFLIGLIIIVIIIGVFLIVRAIRSKSYKGDDKSLVYKEDLPIVPRAERVVSEVALETYNHETVEQDDQDALSTLAKAVSQSATLHVEQTDAPSEPVTKISHDSFQRFPIIDNHLEKQGDIDEEHQKLLQEATKNVNICITPRNKTTGLSGKEVQELANYFGLKYGVMQMYHFYENRDGSGQLLFSMLGKDRQGGAVTFDINNLTNQRFTGLILFVPLPHPHAVRAFDLMVNNAKRMSQQLKADLVDEQDYFIDTDVIAQLRKMVANYQ